MDREMKVHSEQGKIYGGWIINHKGCQSPYPQKAKEELNLSDIGIGVNGDGETKTALFCVIPDSDKSYNFIIGMLYTQIFQELYYQADFNCGGRLPIHVTFMLDPWI